MAFPKLFGDKLTTANARITSLVALLSAVPGFKLDAAAISDLSSDAALPTADQLTAHLATARTTAINEATAPLNAQIATLGAAAAQAAAFATGLEASGVKLGDWISADKGEGDTPEAKAKDAAKKNAAMVTAAVDTTVARKTAKTVAGTGHDSALDIPPGDGGSKADTSGAPKTKEEFHTGLNSITDPGDRNVYFRKYKAKFGL